MLAFLRRLFRRPVTGFEPLDAESLCTCGAVVLSDWFFCESCGRRLVTHPEERSR